MADLRKNKLLLEEVFFSPHDDTAGQDLLLTFADNLFSWKMCNFMHLFCIIVTQARQNMKSNRSYLCSVTIEKIKGGKDICRQS